MRQKRKLVALSVMALSAGMAVQAQDSLRTTQLDEFVFTGTRVETPVEKSGKMIVRLSAEDIQKSGARTMADVLNSVPGVQMDGNYGAPGTNLDYFVRGASSKRTLILIDGVPFNDPSGIDQTYDLRLIDLQQVESVEVLRGGLSSLYGSGAAAAVINIQTKRSAKGPIRLSTGMDFGSFRTMSNYVQLSGTIEKLSYNSVFNRRSSQGFSAADDQNSGGFDKDGMKSINAMLQVGYQASTNLKFEVHSSLDQFENEFDGFAFVDDRQSSSQYVQKRFGSKATYVTSSTTLTGSYFANFLDREFDYGGFPDDYSGVNEQSNIQVNQKAGILTLIGGLDFQRLEYEQPGVDATYFTMLAPYFSSMVTSGGWNVQVGGRLNKHSDYGYQGVFNINPAYSIDLGVKTIKLLANYSTSYITPSLYQLNGPYGNNSLKPETSLNGDIGASFYDGGGFTLNAVYFQRIDEQPIDFRSFFDDQFNFTGGEYYNTDGQSRVEGVEIDFDYVVKKWNFRGNHTWLNPIWGSLRQRMPRLKSSIGASYVYTEGSSVSMNYLWTGKRKQSDPQSFEMVETKAFGLVDMNVTHRFGKLSSYITVNNLLNTEYEAILGYTTIGRNYTVGLRIDLVRK